MPPEIADLPALKYDGDGPPYALTRLRLCLVNGDICKLSWLDLSEYENFDFVIQFVSTSV